MISRSRAALSRSETSRASSSGFHSGMICSRDSGDRFDELAPVIALCGQHAPAVGRDAVEAPPALARFLHPPARDPAALLEAIEQRIQGCDLEVQPAVRALVDQLADLVAVAGAGFDQREDEQLGAALLQLALEHRAYRLHSDILYRRY